MNDGEANAHPDENEQGSSAGSDGTNPSEEPKSSGGEQGRGESLSNPVAGATGEGAKEDGTESPRIKLQPTYHAQLQEALINEKNIEKIKILSELLEKEAQREFQIWAAQNETTLRIQEDTIRSSNEQQFRAIEQARFDTISAKWNLRFSSIIEFSKWLLPAIFAIMIACWMVSFYRKDMCDAARSLREILLLMIGGALGWIAQARTDLGAISKPEPPQTNSN